MKRYHHKYKHTSTIALVIFLTGIVTSVWISHLTSAGPLSSKASTQALLLSPTVMLQKAQAQNKPTIAVSSEQHRLQLIKYITVEAALLGVTDDISLYYKGLNQDEEITFDPERSWIPASTIKAYVAVEAFRQQKVGLIDFNQAITIRADNVVPTEIETNDFLRLREGTQATIRQLVEVMIIQSDNTAYNTLLDILDRRNINQTLRDLGITETVVGEKLNLDDKQFQQDLQVPGRQPNATTVKDLATLFNLLYTKQIANADDILSIFKRQKINNMIPELLPQNIVIAHKTGDWAPIYHDGGIVYKPAKPFTLVIFTNSDETNILAQLAKVAYYQTVDAIGQVTEQKKISLNNSQNNLQSRIYLASGEIKAVLGAHTGQANAATYIVQPGDSLWSIAQKFYNDGFQWVTIARRNYLTDPSTLNAGMKLIIPYASTSENITSPKITAADLGITTKDLTIDAGDINNIQGANIIPGNIFYGTKLFLENLVLTSAQSPTEKFNAYVSIAKHRLSEIKTITPENNVDSIKSLLDGSEDTLKKATAIAKNSQNPDAYLLEIKQLSDFNYAILANKMSLISNNIDKEQLVNAIYNYHQKNRSEIQSVVKTHVIANAVQQEPIIATIVKVSDKTATVKFDNGTTKDIAITTVTSTRDFHSRTNDTKPSLTEGSKVAIIAQTTDKGTIIPIFILRNVPKELPDKVNGMVLEIDPRNNSLKVEDEKGKVDNVIINDNTSIKAKDTNVSLEGIKAGSQVSIVGETQNVKISSPIQVMQIPVTQTAKQSQTNSVNSNTPALSTQTHQSTTIEHSTNSTNNSGTELKATSITVTKNSSGAQEVIDNGRTTEHPQNQPQSNQPPTQEPSNQVPHNIKVRS